VVGRQLAPNGLLRDFHRAHPGVDLDVVTLYDASAAIAAVQAGAIDTSFRAVRELPDELDSVRVLDEPLVLVTHPDHPLAGAPTVRLAQLAGHRIWMPGNVPGTEWAAYYEELAAAFGLTIETTGPDFGIEPLLDRLVESPTLASFVSEQTPLVWPGDYDLRRIALRDPTPVYPHSLIWLRDNPHPTLAALRDHFGTRRPRGGTWTPKWAR
jgi:DNA-binding transcriptional LysR family regulator